LILKQVVRTLRTETTPYVLYEDVQQWKKRPNPHKGDVWEGFIRQQLFLTGCIGPPTTSAEQGSKKNPHW